MSYSSDQLYPRIQRKLSLHQPSVPSAEPTQQTVTTSNSMSSLLMNLAARCSPRNVAAASRSAARCVCVCLSEPAKAIGEAASLTTRKPNATDRRKSRVFCVRSQVRYSSNRIPSTLLPYWLTLQYAQCCILIHRDILFGCVCRKKYSLQCNMAACCKVVCADGFTRDMSGYPLPVSVCTLDNHRTCRSQLLDTVLCLLMVT